MKPSVKSSLLIILFSIAVELSITPFRMISGTYMGLSALMGFLFFFAAYLAAVARAKHHSAQSVAWLLVAGCLIIQLPIRIYGFSATMISLPDFLFHLLGIGVGVLFRHTRSAARWVVFLILLALPVLYVFKGHALWMNKLAYGTFTGQVDSIMMSDSIGFETIDHQKVYPARLKGKIVVLDFWFSKCGVCFSEFPKVETFYQQAKKNPKIYFTSVNYIQEYDKESEVYAMTKQLGYTFPTTVCKDKSIPKILGVTSYPTVLVIDPQGRLVFRGNITQAEKKVNELLYTMP